MFQWGMGPKGGKGENKEGEERSVGRAQEERYVRGLECLMVRALPLVGWTPAGDLSTLCCSPGCGHTLEKQTL